MREMSGHPMVPRPADANLLQPVVRRAQQELTGAFAACRDGDHFVDVTAGEFYRRCRAVAKGFIASGLEPGDRVALMAKTRMEWLLFDYAIVACGGVTVPIYETSSAEQVEWIVGDSDARTLIAEAPAMREVSIGLRPHAGGYPEIVVIDDGAEDELALRGQTLAEAVLDERMRAVTAASVATIDDLYGS